MYKFYNSYFDLGGKFVILGFLYIYIYYTLSFLGATVGLFSILKVLANTFTNTFCEHLYERLRRHAALTAQHRAEGPSCWAF